MASQEQHLGFCRNIVSTVNLIVARAGFNVERKPTVVPFARQAKGKHVKKFIANIAVIAGLHIACPSAQATLLTPGTFQFSADVVGVNGYADASGPQVGSDLTVTRGLAGDIQLTVTSRVFRDSSSSNMLDFVYVVTNTGNANSLLGFAIGGFGGFATDVAYYEDPSYVAGGAALLTATGQRVAFGLFNTDSGMLDPGQSVAVIIKTDATDFNTGSGFGLSESGDIVLFNPAYTPAQFAPAPEPGAMMLCVTGIVGLSGWVGLRFWRRRHPAAV
jgi:hypothetical protein